jgi:hypothetical protein
VCAAAASGCAGATSPKSGCIGLDNPPPPLGMVEKPGIISGSEGRKSGCWMACCCCVSATAIVFDALCNGDNGDGGRWNDSAAGDSNMLLFTVAGEIELVVLVVVAAVPIVLAEVALLKVISSTEEGREWTATKGT